MFESFHSDRTRSCGAVHAQMVESETELLQELHKVGLKECLRQQAPHLERNQPEAKEKGKDRVRPPLSWNLFVL